MLKPCFILACVAVYGFRTRNLTENAACSFIVELVPLTVVKTEDTVCMICIERNLINKLIDFLNGNMLENKRRNIAACSCLESVAGILIPLNLLRLESLITCKQSFALLLESIT